ncbi:hypothetical protein ACJ3XI_00595 [Litorimonas sp. RW-G-Af-16]|uniref:hypothetical protein n=1 Tax=Litorimonas sp. RW-G-Af-16 TaxID=3241168 RepID=UPI00390C7421
MRLLLTALTAILITAPQAVWANMSDRVAFTSKGRVAMKLVSKKPGEHKYMVVSNAPFKVTAKNVIGRIKVKVKAKGKISGLQFGSKAQMPGKRLSCRAIWSSMPRVIYSATKRTAKLRGKPRSQAVIVTVKFPKTAKPKFSFKPVRKVSAPSAAPADC